MSTITNTANDAKHNPGIVQIKIKMTLMTLSSSSLSWLWWEVVFSLLAGAGGIVVFWGLWVEKKAVKDWYGNVADLRSSKLKAQRGWTMLMFGIGLEIVL